MQNAMEEGQKRIEKILVIKPDRQEQIGKRLNEIVNTCLEIDIRGDPDQFKRQRMEENMKKQRELENTKMAALQAMRQQQEERIRQAEEQKR